MSIDTTTQQVTDALNASVRPQDDLFRFVNGTWIESTQIPADQASAGSFIDLRNQAEEDVRTIITDFAQSGSDDPDAAKIGALYNSFMNESVINGLGATPLDPDLQLLDSALTKADLEMAIAQFYSTGVGAPFGIEIDADRNDPDRYIPWAYQSGLGLPDEAFYHADEYASILDAYRTFIPTLYSLATGTNDVEAKEAATQILAVETAIASHHFTVVESRDAELTNNVMEYDDFTALTGSFGLKAILTALGITAENAPQILCMTPRAFTGLGEVWESFDVDTLRTYLRWHLILARAPYLADDISAASFAFYGTVLSGQEVQRDRWKRGVVLVNGGLGEAVGKIYVAKHFPPENKAKMEQLVADLLAAYRESISTLDWMTDETRERALAKLATFTPKIGYPVKWKDYSALEISEDDLLGNIRAVSKFEFDENIARLGKPVDRDEWHMTPQTVNAYYNPVMNEIVFPAAILQPPFFDAEADPAWNYGGIGAVIGHEIGHGFDDQGSKYDGSGRLNNWWTEDDLTEFTKRTKALVDQYSAYVPAQFPADSPHHVNGELTLGENIGDLGGLTIGLKAYNIACQRAGLASSEQAPVLAGLSGIQRVLLSYARIWQEVRRDELMLQRVATDPHSPSEFRCNGVVKNVDAFAEAFNVQPGDALYLAPEERVRIW
ncbi:M13 family metallopeptidase [Arcanobacterium phocae]|uniref:M13 family metallopeptidase n=1 Tax=Arcanobacterium phocae TaxID=131112 RepID=UPI001C10A07B|nr:M13-type metalloendopeptidase [Arcanobacterium phocae]